ncbi:MAG: AAA family ATPase, partial [Halieaceae bacterium]|nr:AAA family ATPase [Halieaceae bacterium]
ELPIPPLERTLPRFEKYCLAIMGAGGTGKTGVLKISETLTVFFAGPETVRKLAPSNAAARLLGGDTLHALCKLPWGKARLTSKKGRLQKSTLELHRKNWRTAVAAYIDEISMVSSDQFLQCDVRFRQAKMQPSHRFGGLALNVCGDFLQLPPVDKDGTRKGLAVPLNDYGVCDVSEAESQCAENATEQKSDEDADVPTARQRKQANVEGRQGFELWRKMRRVVCLTVKVRARGIWSRLQSERRDGKI